MPVQETLNSGVKKNKSLHFQNTKNTILIKNLITVLLIVTALETFLMAILKYVSIHSFVIILLTQKYKFQYNCAFIFSQVASSYYLKQEVTLQLLVVRKTTVHFMFRLVCCSHIFWIIEALAYFNRVKSGKHKANKCILTRLIETAAGK